MRSRVSNRLIGVSATQYSWKYAVSSTALRCSDAALMTPLFHACGTHGYRLAFGLARDPERFGQAAAARHVGLNDIDVAALDQFAKAPARCLFLAGRNAHVDGIGEFRISLEFVGLERLLEPVNADFLELACDADRPLGIGAVAETRIDQDLDASPAARFAARARRTSCSSSLPIGPSRT